jgi:hypothetical protein
MQRRKLSGSYSKWAQGERRKGLLGLAETTDAGQPGEGEADGLVEMTKTE